MADLNKLSEQYELVSNKTNALHMMSEQLLADQNKLSSIGKSSLATMYKELTCFSTDGHASHYHNLSKKFMQIKKCTNLLDVVPTDGVTTTPKLFWT